MHSQRRADVNTKRLRYDGASGVDALPSEMKCRQTLHNQIADTADKINASATLANCVPKVWDESHEKELLFNQQKRKARLVSAHINSRVLPSESTPQLHHHARLEMKRRDTSFIERVSQFQNVHNSITPRPANPEDWKGLHVFVEDAHWSGTIAMQWHQQ